MRQIRLQPKQRQTLNLIKQTGKQCATILGIGGAKGGGKSKMIRDISVILAGELGAQYPNITITIVRRVARDLRDNHIDRLFNEYPELFQYWRASDLELRLPGAKIAARSEENEEDVKRIFLGGYESAIILVDEAQQFQQKELQWIQAAADRKST